jgi:uncharacterized lipoprotein NlpE involved in copper resistance
MMKNLILCALMVISFSGCKTIEEDREEMDPEELRIENTIPEKIPSPREAVNWRGTYSGVLPCDNCGGIETFLTLREGQTYLLKQRYVNPDKEETGQTLEGEFSWNEEGDVISLNSLEGTLLLKVDKKMYLVPLNSNGNEVKPERGNNFRLYK